MLKSHGYADKRIEIIRRARDAEIATAVELDIFRHQKFKTGVHRPNPASVTYRVDVAEKFQIAIQLADEDVV